MKKGFTLMELLAVIVILAIIALIAIPMILGVIETAREEAYKDSVLGAFEAVEYYMLDNNLNEFPKEGIEVKELNLKNNLFKSGVIIQMENNELVAEYVSNGEYCANGTMSNLVINKGECNITAPKIEIIVNEKEVNIKITDENGIIGYEIGESEITSKDWEEIEKTTNIEKTITAEKAGKYYVHAKNKYGKMSSQEYEISESAFCTYEIGTTWDFAYTGDIQEFIAPCKGTYQLEVWGAQGGGCNDYDSDKKENVDVASGGYGGHSLGETTFDKNTVLYVVVGGKGKNISRNNYSASVDNGGYNGGGKRVPPSSSGDNGDGAGSGGGATHIATESGVLANLEEYKDSGEILIVAGGGGGARAYANVGRVGGTGGGELGGAGAKDATYGSGGGGTQESGGSGKNVGSFGKGASGYNNGSAGGGGWYGGGSTFAGGGGGGSGYIGGVVNGSTENGIQAGDGKAKITLVSISN